MWRGNRAHQLLSSVALLAAIAVLPATAQSGGSPPVVTSVSSIAPGPNQTITLVGSGFGSQTAYDGDSSYIEIADLTGNWTAGYINNGSPNQVTLNITSWTDSQIVIQGLTGAYGQNNWVLNLSDKVEVLVWNPQSGAGPATLTVSVGGQASTLPVITSVSNAASYAAGVIAPGEIAYIAGSIAQGVTGYISAEGGVFPAQLAGVSIRFNGVAAPLIYVSATAAAAIVPYEVSGPTAQVTVMTHGQTSVPFQTSVASSAPGLFTANSSGTGEVAALNQDGTVNSSSNPAASGSTVSLFATGEGQTSPPGVDGQIAAAPLPRPLLPVTATVGGQPAKVQYAGGAPGEVAGLMQVNVQIPSVVGLSGPGVPVAITVGNASSQTGATIAVSPPSGPTQVSPGQILSIGGSFDTASSVTTTVAFTDNAGFNMSLTPLSVASGSVSVLVPPYFDTQQGLLRSGAVTVSVIQQPSGRQGTATMPVNLQVAALPQTGLAPGTITLAILSQLIQSIGTANQTWTTIQQESGGLVQSPNLNLPMLGSNLSAMQSQIQALMSGAITQACLGQINGQNICLTTSGLGLLDQLYYAFYLGSTAAPAQVSALFLSPPVRPHDLVDSVQSWYTRLTTSTIPATIRSNASTLRTVVDISVALGTLAFGAEVVTGVAIAAVANMAITWASAAQSAALEGSGSEIRSGDTSNFGNTIGIIEDSQEEFTTLNGSVVGKLKDEAGALLGEAGKAVVEIVLGVETLLNPEDPSSDASEAETAAEEGLFSGGTGAESLTGTWKGSYTEQAACGGAAGSMTLNIQTANSSTFSGSASYTAPLDDNPTDCDLIATLTYSGTFSGTISGENITLTITASSRYQNNSFSESPSFTGTVAGNTMTGNFVSPSQPGSFTLTRQ